MVVAVPKPVRARQAGVLAAALTVAGALAAVGLAPAATAGVDPLFQSGPKLTGTGSVGAAHFGVSVALSGDGNTALVGGPSDAGGFGGAWVFVRAGSTWTEQDAFVAGDEVGQGRFGSSVALSNDGNTALIGGDEDNAGAGAAWVYTRSGTAWTEQAKLTGDGPIGSDEQGNGAFGASVALSSAGEVALVGAPADDLGNGAAWAFSRSGATWNSLGAKIGINSANNPDGMFGSSVALSGAGTTLLIGAPHHDNGVGAAFVFTLVGPTLTLAAELSGADQGAADFGDAAALSGDASTALVGGAYGSGAQGAAWVLTHSPSGWTPLPSPLLPAGETGAETDGVQLGVSGDGSVAIIGGPLDNSGAGAAWVFTATGTTWTQQGQKLTPSDASGEANFGSSVGLSADGSTALIGAPADSSNAGAAWIFGDVPPAGQNVTFPSPPAPRPRLHPRLRYTFRSGRSGTVFSALFLTGVPRAATVRVACRGRGCQFRGRVERLSGRAVCHGRGSHRRCRRRAPPPVGTVTLTRLFHRRALGAGTELTIEVAQPGVIGRLYSLTIRHRGPPGVTVACLAPGSNRPGRGC